MSSTGFASRGARGAARSATIVCRSDVFRPTMNNAMGRKGGRKRGKPINKSGQGARPPSSASEKAAPHSNGAHIWEGFSGQLFGLGVTIGFTGLALADPAWSLVARVMGCLIVVVAALDAGGDRTLNCAVVGLASIMMLAAVGVYESRSRPHLQVFELPNPFSQIATSTLGGIKWDGTKHDLRVIFENDGWASASNGDFVLRFDVQVSDVVQLTNLPDVRPEIFIEGFEIPPEVFLTTKDGHAVPLRRRTDSPTVRLRLGHLSPQERMELLVAPTGSGAVRLIDVTGTYEAADSREVLRIRYPRVGK